MESNRNLLAAVILSILILAGFEYFFPNQYVKDVADQASEQIVQTTPQIPGGQQVANTTNRQDAIDKYPRIKIKTPELSGSISLVGGRLDDLKLINYDETLDGTEPVTLLSPAKTNKAYYVNSGWLGSDQSIKLPTSDTRWRVVGNNTLTPKTPVTMRWNNGQGLLFTRMISIDDHFMFTINQSVENASKQPVTLYPYSLAARNYIEEDGRYILHTGVVGYLNDELQELDWDDLEDDGTISKNFTDGWLGFTDKYWFVGLIPNQENTYDARMLATKKDGRTHYQIDLKDRAYVVEPGSTVNVTKRIFAGAKRLNLLDDYEDQYGIPSFDLAIDFGWFYFMTRPFSLALIYLGHLFGQFGLGILAFTVFLKMLTYPLANKSFVEMSRMKKLGPQMEKIRERHKGDSQKMQQDIMALYKKEKVNPMSGCLPIFVQIPIFFALYKTLYVTIEMRHAPFFGWIQDLSAPDPTSFINLFGVIPFDPPSFLMIGAWPLMMGVTMLLQQRLSPTPTDPIQGKVMMLMPIMFTFILARFPAGLVIYYTWSNILSITQQYIIQKRMGLQPQLFWSAKKRKAWTEQTAEESKKKKSEPSGDE